MHKQQLPPNEDMTDEALFIAYVQGDEQAFATLYHKHKGGLYRYFLRQGMGQDKAQDLFQDVWGKAITRASQYEAKAKFTTWLYTIAHNTLVDKVRHLSVVDKVIDGQVNSDDAQLMGQSSSHHGTDNISQEQASQALKKCIAAMPYSQQECFLLKQESGLTAQEIAHIANIGLEACKSRLRAGLSLLKQCLQRKLGDDCWVFEQEVVPGNAAPDGAEYER